MIIEDKKDTPPAFTSEKLKTILKYTDLDANPVYDAFLSNSIYEIHSGAKGVSKSFAGAVITIYRIVNDKRFNSIWCRNRYKHIKNTLRPLFLKVLDFLKTDHGLDYTPFFDVKTEAIYWTYEDGGKGRGIYFHNWENVQSLQGVTLPQTSFFWGEFVIDEPIEDPRDYNDPETLNEIYKIQEEALFIILANTIFREKAPEDFQIKAKFFYNIFTHKHFLITNYHLNALPFCDAHGNPYPEYLTEILESKFIQKDLPDFIKDQETGETIGLIVTMYAKTFVPSAKISTQQKINLNNLKSQNYRLWVITVAGLTYADNNNQKGYFLKSLIYDTANNYKDNITFVTSEDISNKIKSGELKGVFYGYDPGRVDNAAFVCLLAFTNELILFEGIEDIKKLIKKPAPTLKEIHTKLIDLIAECNNRILEDLKGAWSYNSEFNYKNYFSNLDLDNITEIELLHSYFMGANLPVNVRLARRRTTKNGDFSILGRQEKTKLVLSYSALKFNSVDISRKLLYNLSRQYIEPNEEKRNEKVNPEIYDLINAFEYALNRLWHLVF
ncbi:hypothetical protein [Mycoplasmopsis columboralis]|uniref:Uncharacterized protein n=1 Tax=Mycoplasmopsis columboralis TaxID=171282 RepID=A0A449B5X0_9BACT|nr:hypothetical protein [Mycoplasmopsis columboralis]VEU75959.1 Uncharacterised protein [Mycoplasmopsis columboralis]